MGMIGGHRLDPLVRRHRNPAMGQGHDRMIEPLQREAVQVREIARHVQLADLAGAVAEILEAAGQTIEQQQADVKPLPGPDQGLVGPDLLDFAEQAADRLLLRCAHCVAGAELEEVDIDHAGGDSRCR